MNLLGTKRANKYFVSFDPKSNFLISLISAKRLCSTFVIERYPYVVEIVMHKSDISSYLCLKLQVQ